MPDKNSNKIRVRFEALWSQVAPDGTALPAAKVSRFSPKKDGAVRSHHPRQLTLETRLVGSV
jgi:hypothetical protein